MITVPKGTKDVLPAESYKWQYVEETARGVAAAFGLSEIRTPVFEHTELFLRGIGEGTDVVSKEMYTFLDKGERSITLKPEGTAPVARALLENSLDAEGLPVKLFYLTPVFRYENPQAGRLREHHQFGAEFYGSAGAAQDAEVIALAAALLKKLGVSYKLFINSIGCKECRAGYRAALVEYFKPRIGKMCKDCAARLEKNPLRLLDCKEEGCKREAAAAPKTIDFLCSDCSEHFERLKSFLTAAKIEFGVNPNIVRGLDYYNRTVFEFVTAALGAQGTICGGGRYDGLLESVGGKALPAVGFGMGLERILMLMEAENIVIPAPNPPLLYLASAGAEAEKAAFEICNGLRNSGVACETDTMGRSIKAQMRSANRLKAVYCAVLGDNELASSKIAVKRMSDGAETTVDLSALAGFIAAAK